MPPGFDAATENGNGLGIGKVPPGLAKLFGNDEVTGLPPGFDAATENGNGLGIGNIPPGQAKKFDDYSASFEQTPDDYFENSYESQIDDVFEINFDGTNKGNGDGKGKFGAFPGKSGEDPKIKIAKDSKNRNSNNGGGADTIICHLPNSVNKTLKLSSNALPAHVPGHATDTLGACGGSGNNAPVANAGLDQPTVAENTLVTLDGSGSTDVEDDATPVALTYAWVLNPGSGVATLSDPSAINPTFTSQIIVGGGAPDIVLVFTLTVTDSQGAQNTDTVSITVINS